MARRETFGLTAARRAPLTWASRSSAATKPVGSAANLSNLTHLSHLGLLGPPGSLGHRGVPEATAGLVDAQLSGLEATVSDLLETRDADEVLAKVVENAAAAVPADRLVLAVRLTDGAAPAVHARGVESEETARAIGIAMLGGQDCSVCYTPSGSERLTSEVRSAQRSYGVLAAYSETGFADGQAQLLDAYARLAATALDARVALEEAATRRRTAEVLGAFATRLVRIEDTAGVAAATVEAAQEIVGSDRALVFRLCEEDASLRVVGHRGHPDAIRAVLDDLVVTAEDTPEFRTILEHPDVARVYGSSENDSYLGAMMRGAGIECFAAVPIRSGDRLFGVLATSWVRGNAPADLDELVRRLGGAADQAAGAWEKALLIEQVRRQASIDTLTGCANRRLFTEELASRLAVPDGPPLAVLFCDLDRFKAVNDLLGHAAGDDLLVAVGRRLQHCVRSDDIVARLGGDEFTVLLTEVGEDWNPQAFEAKVRQAMEEPVEIEGSQVVVHLSIGTVVASPGEATVKEVLRKADAAMYGAKARGGDRLLVFEEHLLAERSERLEVEASLVRASRRLEQFVVAYQPQVDLATGRVVAAEALVRWQHPALGWLTPDKFLPIAEETGVVVPIDLHVLATALRQVATWRQAGAADLRVAVNFSARTLASPDLLSALEKALESAGVPGEALEIELTESTAVSDTEALSAVLSAIGRLGVSVAIDDVGTGYSSLALLHRLPARRIKIDRSFVQRITDDTASRSVVEAVLLLADRLHQSVVAEGIETVEQADALRTFGCELGQGYLFARPGSPDDVLKLALAADAVPSAAGWD